ncbi:MAG: DUF3011 domain-containing protein [Hydrogenophaga sp.]|nr:DUF3011 domain-containing protein [Hydrogenophaga sp.]
MSGRRTRKGLALALCGLLSVGPAAARGEFDIRCESDSYRYRYCPAQTDNRVNMIRQLSKSSCQQNYSWGYDRGGVWVDKGCAAEFRIGGGREGLSRGEKNALGVVAGLAILGAIANNNSNSNHNPPPDRDVYPWAVGSFNGFDTYENTSVQINILPGGNLSGYAGNGNFSGFVRGTHMNAGRHSFRISQQGNGFMAVDERDGNHRVFFQRMAGGY